MHDLWIDISQAPLRSQMPAALLLYTVLGSAALAVAHRTTLCQLQAYAMLLTALAVFVVHYFSETQRRENTVETVRYLYCVDCKNESRGAMVVGRLANNVESSYERFYFKPLRIHLAIGIWLGWIAYGSVFHEAQHSAAEDASVAGFIHHWTSGPWADTLMAQLRSLRVLVLWFVACHDVASRNTTHSIATAAVFFVALFFPTVASTAQGVSLLSLLARTSTFVTLFVLCEVAERVDHYCMWIGNFDEKYQIHLSTLLMALGLSRPQRMSASRSADEIFIPIGDPASVGRVFSLRTYLSQWRIVVRCGWILVASDGAIGLATLQCIFVLARMAAARTRTVATVKRKNTMLQPAAAISDDNAARLEAPLRSSGRKRIVTKTARSLSAPDDSAGASDPEPAELTVNSLPKTETPPLRVSATSTPTLSEAQIAQLVEQAEAARQRAQSVTPPPVPPPRPVPPLSLRI